MAEYIKLTQEGFDKLMAELEDLKVNRRRENAEKLKIAREQGDLSENAEYDAAKDEQSQIENRIAELEEIKKHHTIVAESTDNTTIQIGTTVHLVDVNSKEEYTFKLQTSTESNILEGSISDESPVGAGIRGKKVGDVVTVVPVNSDKEFQYKILDFHK